MARMIDAYQAIDIIDEWLDSVGTVMVGKGLSSYGELIGCIEEAPTLTQPNGSAADTNVGAKDKNIPTKEPNEPLTLEELREMDGEPVWLELEMAWALVEVKPNGGVMFHGNDFTRTFSYCWDTYRRPPEGEEET